MDADYLIVNGDPAEKLLAQLFDVGRQSYSLRPTLRLKLQYLGESKSLGGVVGVKIHGLQFCYPKNSHIHVLRIAGWTVAGAIIDKYVPESYFEGEYDTRSREGWIKLMPDPYPFRHC